MKRIAVVSLKGGTGKTTTSFSLATAFSHKGSTVLVDLDPQNSAGDLYRARVDVNHLELIELSRTRLESRLADLAGYDYMVIDTAPALTVQMSAAIEVSDLVICVVRPGYADYYALMRMQEHLNSALGKVVILLTQSNATNLSKGFREELEQSGYPVLKTELKQRVAYAESLAEGMNVIEWAPGSIAALELKKLIKEVMEYLK